MRKSGFGVYSVVWSSVTSEPVSAANFRFSDGGFVGLPRGFHSKSKKFAARRHFILLLTIAINTQDRIVKKSHPPFPFLGHSGIEGVGSQRTQPYRLGLL